jgi:hypothetical protein
MLFLAIKSILRNNVESRALGTSNTGDMYMTSTTSIFFAGVGTSLLLIGAGFGSGLLLGQAAVDVPQKSRTGWIAKQRASSGKGDFASHDSCQPVRESNGQSSTNVAAAGRA